ncbi:MAG: 50S ribosomal protein L24 [Rickettsiaceae bacterium]
MKCKFKTGDEVIIISGKDKGVVGKITKILTSQYKAIIAGANLSKKHTKPTQTSNGGIVQKEMPIHISNIAHIDPKTGSPTKIKYILQDNKKLRVAKKSGEILSSTDK